MKTTGRLILIIALVASLAVNALLWSRSRSVAAASVERTVNTNLALESAVESGRSLHATTAAAVERMQRAEADFAKLNELFKEQGALLTAAQDRVELLQGEVAALKQRAPAVAAQRAGK